MSSVITYLTAAIIVTLIIASMTVLELALPRSGYSVQQRLPGLAFNIVNAMAGSLLVGALSILWSKAGYTPAIRVPVRGITGDLLSVMAALLLFDLIAYWNHRFQHRFLWRIHALHHCQTELHAANDYAHFTEQGLRFLLFALPLSVISFDFAPMPMIVVLARSSLEFYIHSPTKLHFGIAARLLVDNRFHRIHHSLDQRHFDKNFGILFSFWDEMFRTAHRPLSNEWPETGVADLEPPTNLRDYILFPFKTSADNGSAASARLRSQSHRAPRHN